MPRRGVGNRSRAFYEANAARDARRSERAAGGGGVSSSSHGGVPGQVFDLQHMMTNRLTTINVSQEGHIAPRAP